MVTHQLELDTLYFYSLPAPFSSPSQFQFPSQSHDSAVPYAIYHSFT